MSFHRSRQRDSKAVASFGGSHRSMSELIGVFRARLTAGVYLCNSACAGRGHAHNLGRAFTEAPIASRRLSRQSKRTLTRTELRPNVADRTTSPVRLKGLRPLFRWFIDAATRWKVERTAASRMSCGELAHFGWQRLVGNGGVPDGPKQ